MPHKLDLPEPFRSQGWRIKILENERLEEPHATVCFRTLKWRWGLRGKSFLDKKPPATDVPSELVDLLHDHHIELCTAWNAMYPENVVRGM